MPGTRVRSYIPKEWIDIYKEYKKHIQKKYNNPDISDYQIVQHMILKTLKEYSGDEEFGQSLFP